LFILDYIYLIYCKQIKKNQIIIKQYIDNSKIIEDLEYKYFYSINISTITIAKSNIIKSIIFDFNIIVILIKNIELKNNIKIVFIIVKIVLIVVVVIIANIKLENNFKIVSIAIVITINNLEKQIVEKEVTIKKNNSKKIVKKKTIVITIIF